MHVTKQIHHRRRRPKIISSPLPFPPQKNNSVAWTPELAGVAEERVVTVDEEGLALWALGADGRAVKVRT